MPYFGGEPKPGEEVGVRQLCAAERRCPPPRALLQLWPPSVRRFGGRQARRSRRRGRRTVPGQRAAPPHGFPHEAHWTEAAGPRASHPAGKTRDTDTDTLSNWIMTGGKLLHYVTVFSDYNDIFVHPRPICMMEYVETFILDTVSSLTRMVDKAEGQNSFSAPSKQLCSIYLCRRRGFKSRVAQYSYRA